MKKKTDLAESLRLARARQTARARGDEEIRYSKPISNQVVVGFEYRITPNPQAAQTLTVVSSLSRKDTEDSGRPSSFDYEPVRSRQSRYSS